MGALSQSARAPPTAFEDRIGLARSGSACSESREGRLTSLRRCKEQIDSASTALLVLFGLCSPRSLSLHPARVARAGILDLLISERGLRVNSDVLWRSRVNRESLGGRRDPHLELLGTLLGLARRREREVGIVRRSRLALVRARSSHSTRRAVGVLLITDVADGRGLQGGVSEQVALSAG